MLEGLHKLTAVLIQTWISSWKEIHVLWMSLHSVCLLLSIVVSLSWERKNNLGHGACQRNLNNVTFFFQYVMNLPSRWWFSFWTLPFLCPQTLPSLPQLGWMITRCLHNELIHFYEAAYQSCAFPAREHICLSVRSKKNNNFRVAWRMLMSKLQTSDGAEWQDDCDFTRLDRAKHVPSWVQSSTLECASWMSHNVER